MSQQTFIVVTNIHDYHLICILPIFSKVIEMLAQTRSLNYLNKFNLLSSQQFDFWNDYSTEQALINNTDKRQFIDEGFVGWGPIY